MSEVFALTLAAMHRDAAQLDRIAQNVANVATPGYRRQVGAAQPFTAALSAAQASASPERTAEAPATPPDVRVRLDSRPASLRLTGQALDFAIEGEGYFEVLTEAGPAYTRQGAFQLDARGRLVSSGGQPVMGTNGEIVLTTRTPAVDAAGRITEPDATSASTPALQLKIVRFENESSLRGIGDGLLAGAAAPQPMQEGEATVRQGALENSNVNLMQEMVLLLQTIRHFESMQTVVQNYDDLLSTAIRKLGDLA